MKKLEIIRLDGGVLRFAGALDIYGVELAREALLEQFGHGNGLCVDLSELEHCDAAGAQLLVAGRRTAVAAGKSFSFSAVSPALEDCSKSIGIAAETWLPHTPLTR